MFEISVQDVIDLSDGDLRELTARLSIADLVATQLPPTMVIWGGDQRAPDGGIDVRVQIPQGVTLPTRFDRRLTGFQVKATKMAPADIHAEMRPGGLLRASIRELARAGGSYVFITSDFASDLEYGNRVRAMKAALAEEPGTSELHVDYFDARRLADWTNQHPGIVAWVRNRVSRPLQGWKPFGQWVSNRGGKPQPFLLDDKQRFVDPQDLDRKFLLTEGLSRIREILRGGGSSVRLTGLSGVGKTRFAQALFEADASPDPLPVELAVYTDTAYSPDPHPLALLEQLLGAQRRTILIVDNCSSQLHSQLTARNKSAPVVSLLTIEYDIRDDFPDETSVFRLETGSPELIEKVLGQQFPHISQVNVATITKFADGNSRVALALANTLERNESIVGLGSRELFERLFWVGKEVEPDLLAVAQACALVYSFNGEDLELELPSLGALIGRSVHVVYAQMVELEHRGLAQRRGIWRAVLPHAVANYLANQALELIPAALIERHLVSGRGRLLRSFSRRLGYLHKSPHAVRLVQKWLSAGEVLGEMEGMTPEMVEMLINVAPVDGDAALRTIERAITGPDKAKLLSREYPNRRKIVLLLRSLAYDPKLFERCLACLLEFALAEAPDDRTDRTRSVIESLFALYLSGTHATIAQRTGWVKTALESPNAAVQTIGLGCLSAALKSHHFSSHYSFDFGARNRDYGWTPRGSEVKPWFKGFIEVAAEFARRDDSLGESVREILATHFRSLWTVAQMVDELEVVACELRPAGWEKGWIAIRQTLRFDGKGMSAPIKARLDGLKERLAPKTLVSRVKAAVLNGGSGGFDIDEYEDIQDSFQRVEKAAHELGALAAQDDDARVNLLPLLVRNQPGRQGSFGEGLAAGATSVPKVWEALIEAFESTDQSDRNIQVLRGFMTGAFKRDPSVFEALLDGAMNHSALVPWVPVLQLGAPLDEKACARLMAAMDNPRVPAWVFSNLGLGRATEKLPDGMLAALLQRLSIKPQGVEIAVDVLFMHTLNNPNPIGPELRTVANTLLGTVELAQCSHEIAHALAGLVLVFLKGPEGKKVAGELLTRLREGLEDYTLSGHQLGDLISALFRVQPVAALDILVGDEPDEGDVYIRRRALAEPYSASVLSDVPIEGLVAWCSEGPDSRWAYIASLLSPLETHSGEVRTQWAEDALALLRQSPRPVEVARALVDLILPTSWSGSRAEAIRSRLPLLDQLESALGPAHDAQVAGWRSGLMKVVEREAERELQEHRAGNERFE